MSNFSFGNNDDDDDFNLDSDESGNEEIEENSQNSQNDSSNKMENNFPIAKIGEISCPNGHPAELNFNYCPYCSEEILQNKTKNIPLSQIQCSFDKSELLGSGICGSVFKV